MNKGMKTFNLGWKIAIILIALTGILIQLGIFQGVLNLYIFHYFTILSNVFAVVILSISAHKILSTPPKNLPYTWAPLLKGMVIMCLMITMIVSHFLLNQYFQMTGILGISVTLLHYVVPFMVLIDYLLFDSKGWMRNKSPLQWIMAPLIYVVFALIAAQIGDGIGYGNSRYPYPFLDVEILGWSTVILIIFVMAIAILFLGYLFVLFDSIYVRHSTRS